MGGPTMPDPNGSTTVDAEGHSPFKDVINFIFRMEVHRCCCAWRRDIFHNCITAIHLCSGNPNAQLFSGDCVKPFDGVMVTHNRFTLFECMIKSKLRAELVGIIPSKFLLYGHLLSLTQQKQLPNI